MMLPLLPQLPRLPRLPGSLFAPVAPPRRGGGGGGGVPICIPTPTSAPCPPEARVRGALLLFVAAGAEREIFAGRHDGRLDDALEPKALAVVHKLGHEVWDRGPRVGLKGLDDVLRGTVQRVCDARGVDLGEERASEEEEEEKEEDEEGWLE